MKQQTVKVFCSYSHKDEELKQSLEEHLSLLRRKGIIKEFNDRKIVPGQEWGKEISRKLKEADIVLFLLSSSFLNSDYCNDIEVKLAFNKYESGNIILIPVIVRPCDWQESSLAKFQVLPKDGKAITVWENKDQAWMNVVSGIKRAISGKKLNTNLKADCDFNKYKINNQHEYRDYADNGSIQIKENSGNINIFKG